MKLIVQTQYRENYGIRWKNKGGMTYVVQFHDANIVQQLAADVIKEVEWDQSDDPEIGASSNIVIDWFVIGDAEKYPDDLYDVYHLELVDGQWKQRHEVVYDSMAA